VSARTGVIRVLLADDHSVVRLGLRSLLGDAPDVEVVGEARDGHEALEACERLAPDVVVMDLSMGGMDGASATREIVRRRGGADAPRVLVLTMHEEEEYLIPLLEAGASGYVVKDAAGDELVHAVQLALQDQTYLHPQLGARIASQEPDQGPADDLSDREREVLRLIALGHTNGEIASQLFLSVRTVESHRAHIQQKLGLTTRAELVRYALDSGLIGTE
jgi:two-component system, NarL family, response regulator NreC